MMDSEDGLELFTATTYCFKIFIAINNSEFNFFLKEEKGGRAEEEGKRES